MAQRKATMKKIREILRLKEESGLSLRKISRAMKLSRPVVTDYIGRCLNRGLDYKRIKDMPDDELEALLRSDTLSVDEDERYSALAGQFEHFLRDLGQVGVTRYILWEEYRIKNPGGYGYSQFCYHFQAWKASQELSMHMEHKAGDKLFVDYAGQKMSIVDRMTGEVTPVEVFVAILGASQLTYVEATLSQKKQDFIDSVAGHSVPGLTPQGKETTVPVGSSPRLDRPPSIPGSPRSPVVINQYSIGPSHLWNFHPNTSP